MYKTKHFKIKELVHPEFLQTTNEDTLWQLFDDRLLRCADKIRDLYGPCTVNANGLVDCGLRLANSTTGAKYSAHKYGRALDIHIRTIELAAAKIKNPAERQQFKIQEYNKVRNFILNTPVFDCLNVEKDVSWLHIDTLSRPSRTFNG